MGNKEVEEILSAVVQRASYGIHDDDMDLHTSFLAGEKTDWCYKMDLAEEQYQQEMANILKGQADVVKAFLYRSAGGLATLGAAAARRDYQALGNLLKGPPNRLYRSANALATRAARKVM